MRITRRKALRGMAAAAVAPLIKGCTPASGGSNKRGPVVVPEFSPKLVADRIRHVVVLMMENRSFDHYLGAGSLHGTWPGLDGLTHGMGNPLMDGTMVKPAPADIFCQADPGHGWNVSHDQFNGGTNDGFVRVHQGRYGATDAHRVMDYYDASKLSATWPLCRSGALCQRWFASVMGPTWPNRYYLLAGDSQGRKSNDAIVGDFPHLFTRLDQKRIGWSNHYGNIPFGILLPSMSLDDPEFRYLEQFHQDAADGNLAPFTLLDPIYGRNDDHPPTHPVAGQVLIQSVYASLAASPQWAESLLVVTYDEHGGFFDHVPPPMTQDAFAADGFDQLGFRVPSFAVGPYVKPGFISDTVLQHGSVYRTLEQMWELDPLTVRTTASNDLFGLLDEQRLRNGQPAAPINLAPIQADENEIYAEHCNGARLFTTTPWRGTTGQPELEAVAEARFGNHPRNRIPTTDQAYESFLEVARSQGVLARRW